MSQQQIATITPGELIANATADNVGDALRFRWLANDYIGPDLQRHIVEVMVARRASPDENPTDEDVISAFRLLVDQAAEKKSQHDVSLATAIQNGAVRASLADDRRMAWLAQTWSMYVADAPHNYWEHFWHFLGERITDKAVDVHAARRCEGVVTERLQAFRDMIDAAILDEA